MRQLFDHRDMVNLVEPSARPMQCTKAWIALSALLLVMVLAAFEVLPIAALALIAAKAVVAFGCLQTDEAYASVRWNILMLIFAMLALGIAMEKTGAARLTVEWFAGAIGDPGHRRCGFGEVGRREPLGLILYFHARVRPRRCCGADRCGRTCPWSPRFRSRHHMSIVGGTSHDGTPPLTRARVTTAVSGRQRRSVARNDGASNGRG
jgi:hypothetical protein